MPFLAPQFAIGLTFYSKNMLLLLGLYIGVTFLQILIWGIFPAGLVWRKTPESTNSTSNKDFPPVSVVICARNEAENLKNGLPDILEQHYPSAWEIIVVDDDSDDDTTAVLSTLSRRYPQLKAIRCSPKKHPGKKQALTLGIQSARFDWIVLTDADCKPPGTEWLQKMMEKAENPAVILGYAPLYPSPPDWVNRWARYETLYTALQYLSTARMGWPFMGVGRNLAWHKSLFFSSGGFSGHAHIPGGDDDLFVNQVAHRQNTQICIQKEAFMYSFAKPTFRQWLLQKRRHLHAGLGYKTWHNLVLGGVAFTHSVHYGLAAIILLVSTQYWPVILAGYLLRMLVVWPVMFQACRVFREKNMAVFIPILDGLMAVWVGAVAPVLLVARNKKLTWK